MGKRSHDVSFSPSAEGAFLPTTDTETSSETDALAPPVKQKAVDVSSYLPSEEVMQCSLPPHRDSLHFTSIDEFELHYVKEHTNRCSECGKNFPTAHFLALHIDENHNPLREALEVKGEKTYACFVEDCDRKCSTPQKRRMHLIDKHMFPKTYSFRLVDTGIDRQTSMLKEGQRRRISTTSGQRESFGHRRRTSSIRVLSDVTRAGISAKPSTHQNASSNSENMKQNTKPAVSTSKREGATVGDQPGSKSNGDVDDLERSMSALKFVPTSVLMRDTRHKKSGS